MKKSCINVAHSDFQTFRWLCLLIFQPITEELTTRNYQFTIAEINYFSDGIPVGLPKEFRSYLERVLLGLK